MTRWTALADRARDDRGSLPMVLLVTIVGMLLTALLVPVLLNQDHSTRFDTSRVTSLDAAQAGIDVAMGKIRSARNASQTGDPTKLPCGPITGTVDASGTISYTTKITYYTADPVSDPTASAMLCVDGYGTYDTGTGLSTPSYAQISSTGNGGGGNGASKGRTLVSTYRFKMNNLNVPGGVIRIYPASSTSSPFCLDAGTATPATGDAVKLQACSTTTPPADQQVFVYRTDLTLQLLSSVTATNANGLCLSYSSTTTGTAVKFAACSALGSAPWTQQWSFDDSGEFQASLSNTATTGKGALSGQCMDVASQAANTAATIQKCVGSTTSPRQAWIPAPSVGAGAAAAPQFVNYYEFGRCIDVTNQNVNMAYLIDYPCKQNPYSGAVAWNQKFTSPTIPKGSASATGTFVTNNGSNYCLTSPRTNGGSVVVKPCSGSTAGQTWTVYNDDDSLSYSQKFTIVDSAGLCLSLGDPQGGMVWSTIAVETCNGAADQKWNATPTTPSTLNTQEN
jgi:hypothetical protein